MKEKLFDFRLKNLLTAFGWLISFACIGIWRWSATGSIFYVLNFTYIGGSIAIGMFLNSSLKKQYKPWGRRITHLLIGLYMLGFLGFVGWENMQIEGFFFYLFAGVFAGGTLHYFIAKIVGPFFFGRGWCGWACWTAMILDLLPWKKPVNGRLRHLGVIRYIHLFLSFGLVFVLFFLFDYKLVGREIAVLYLLIAGNAIYYTTGIILAAVLKDNRAFCKYVCPIPPLQKIGARFSIYKQEIDSEKCTDCQLCEKNCPMGIKLLAYKNEGKRILSTECILCNVCTDVCPTNAIKSTKRFDAGFKEQLFFKEK